MTDQNLNPNTRERIVVAMSGGVDSSVAAALLVEQGHEVIGMMMRLWSEPSNSTTPAPNRCCTPDQMADARRVADRLEIPFYVLDMQEHFRNTIVQFFIDEHALGRTPNPCINCNRQIRFTALLDHALALDAQYLATGHYARVSQTDSGYSLLKAIDETKDQSYVLHVLNQQQLAHVQFPVGRHSKMEVRELARQFKLPVARKDESQDLCFVSDGDYRRFLRDHGGHATEPGPIVDGDGRTLGKHEGLPFYTVGQRKGLGISAPSPLFVLRKDLTHNALIVGSRDQLGQRHLIARDVNWVSGCIPDRPLSAQVKIRYRAKAVPAIVSTLDDGRVRVEFAEAVTGITPGQGAVFYNADVCLGGGIIADDPATQAAADDSANEVTT